MPFTRNNVIPAKAGISALKGFFFAVIFFLIACSEGPSECFHVLKINYWSTTDIDSILFYLDNKQICDGKTKLERDHRKKNGYKENVILCKTSLEDSALSIVTFDEKENCISSEDTSLWRVFICVIDEEQYGNEFNSSILSSIVYANTDISKFNVFIPRESFKINEYGNSQGVRYHIISEQDTAKWNQFRIDIWRKNILINSEYDEFNIPYLEHSSNSERVLKFSSCSERMCYFDIEEYNETVCRY